MTEEYITRKAARDVLSALAIRHFELTDLYKIYIKALEDADADILKIPATDVAPVRHGKWIKPTRVPDSMMDECSLCGFDCGSYTYNYCPSCGARMDGGKNV